MLSFDLSEAAPDPITFNLSAVVADETFTAISIRVVSSDDVATVLLVGGSTDATTVPYPAVLIYGSVTAGSNAFKLTGSVVLPSSGSGVTSLSQSSLLHGGFVLANTDMGVFKCEFALFDRIVMLPNTYCAACVLVLLDATDWP